MSEELKNIRHLERSIKNNQAKLKKMKQDFLRDRGWSVDASHDEYVLPSFYKKGSFDTTDLDSAMFQESEQIDKEIKGD